MAKELNTRIALKYDSYANWTNENLGEGKGANLVLLSGELGICEIPVDGINTDTRVAPTVLFKVGGAKYPADHEKAGQLMAFKDLPWASAKAADVYNWAKASDVVLEGKIIKFVGTNKTITLNYVTESEVVALLEPIKARIEALEGKFDENGAITDALASLDERLDAIEGVNGTIATGDAATLASAKSYTDTREAAIKTAYEKYADDLNTAMGGRVQVLEAAKESQAGLIAANTKAITDEASARSTAITNVTTAYEAADKAITDKIGTGFDNTNTVAVKVKAAQAAAEAAQADVDALTESGGAITVNAAAIEQLRTDLSTETTNRTNADNALDERLERVEAFFNTVDNGEGYDGLNKALDTLVEIQEYLNSEEGAATGGLIGRVSANEEAISDLQTEFAAGGRITVAEAAIEGVVGRASTLESIVKGYTSEGSIKSAVDAAKEQADKGVEDAGKAQEAANKAQEEIDALELVVGDENSGLIKLVNNVKGAAEQTDATVEALSTRVGVTEGHITTLQGIVSTGANANSALRSDITELQNLVQTSGNSNAKLREDLTTLQGIINNETTGLAKTKEIADSALSKANINASKIEAIEADYLRAVDEYIFQCGSSTSTVHTV